MPGPKWREIFGAFFKVGLTGFGGPVALVALMDTECRQRRGWVSTAQFNEAVLFCKLLPGPFAYQVALWVGYQLKGIRGGLVACVAFLLPGFSLMLILAAGYHQWGQAQGMQAFLQGVRTGAVVIIASSVWAMAAPYRSSPLSWAFAVFGLLWMLAVPRWEPVAIVLGGLSMLWLRTRRRRMLLSVDPVSWSVLFALFWVHFKAGAFVYGTGVAVLPFLSHEAVGFHQWITQGEFLDGIGFAQATPGPLTIVSAFIGHQTAGFWGAVWATIGMYLPGMLFVLMIVPALYAGLRGTQALIDFQDGALPVVIGAIAGAWWMLVPDALGDSRAWIRALILVSCLFFWRKFPAWFLILGAGGLAVVGI